MPAKPDLRAQLDHLEKLHEKNALRRLLNAFTVVVIVRTAIPLIFDLFCFDNIVDFLMFFPLSALDSAIFTIINAAFSAFFFTDSIKEQCRIDELRKQIEKDFF